MQPYISVSANHGHLGNFDLVTRAGSLPHSIRETGFKAGLAVKKGNVYRKMH